MTKNRDKLYWVASELAWHDVTREIDDNLVNRPFYLPADDLDSWLDHHRDSHNNNNNETNMFQQAEALINKRLSEIYNRKLNITTDVYMDLLPIEVRRTISYVFLFLNGARTIGQNCQIAYYKTEYEKPISTFNEFREIFNYQHIGQEILCDAYIMASDAKEKICLGRKAYKNPKERYNKNRKLSTSKASKLFYRSIKLLSYMRQPKMISLGTYWDVKAVINLYLTTHLRYRHITNIALKNTKSDVNHELREDILSTIANDDDMLVRITISIIAKWWPSEAVEGIQDKISEATFITTQNFPKVKYWYFENWISNFDSSVIRAVVNQSGKSSTINCEHNVTANIFSGNSNDFVYQSANYNTSLGPVDNKDILNAGSLFKFDIGLSSRQLRKNKNRYLAVLGLPTPHSPDVSGMSGDYGRINGPKSIQDTRRLLDLLPNNVRQKTILKLYPQNLVKRYGGYDLSKYLDLNSLGYKSVIDGNIPAKSLMLKSELLITNYVGTVRLEGLRSNLPTIIYWDEDRYTIDEKYRSDIDSLIDAKIVHSTVTSLVKHINDIDGHVLDWWLQPKVQIARLNFLKNHCDNGHNLMAFIKALYMNCVNHS